MISPTFPSSSERSQRPLTSTNSFLRTVKLPSIAANHLLQDPPPSFAPIVSKVLSTIRLARLQTILTTWHNDPTITREEKEQRLRAADAIKSCYIAGETKRRGLEYQTDLCLRGLDKITSLPEEALAFLKETTKIDLIGFRSLASMSFPATLTKLRSINLPGCESLDSIIFPDTLTEVREINLSGGKNLVSVIFSDALRELIEANLSYCPKLPSVIFPDTLTKLQRVDLSYCSRLPSVSFSGALRALTQVNLSHSGLASASISGDLRSLRDVNLSFCPRLTQLDPALVRLPTSCKIATQGCRLSPEAVLAFERAIKEAKNSSGAPKWQHDERLH